MAKLINLADHKRVNRRITFTKQELRLLLDLYSKRVARGVWRDYAIDYEKGMAVFSMFRSTHEVPLYRVAKVGGKGDAPPEWMVFSGREQLKRNYNLAEVLRVFDRELELVS